MTLLSLATTVRPPEKGCLMKVKALAVAAGASAPLILAGSAPAGFTGISTASKPNDFGIFVVNVYATFDRPGEDLMVIVAGTRDNPLSVRVEGGTFFQHPMGSFDRAPLGAQIDIFPDLRYDTFVTIGVKQVGPSADGNPGQPFDHLTLTPGWPGFGPSNLELTNAGWVSELNNRQSDPFDPVFFPGDGRILIGQFSTADGAGISGTMLLRFISNGVWDEAVVTFDHSVPACPWDLDGNGDVGIEDFLALLAAWGTDPGGPPDFDGDGDVGITDFLELFANWGPCP